MSLSYNLQIDCEYAFMAQSLCCSGHDKTSMRMVHGDGEADVMANRAAMSPSHLESCSQCNQNSQHDRHVDVADTRGSIDGVQACYLAGAVAGAAHACCSRAHARSANAVVACKSIHRPSLCSAAGCKLLKTNQAHKVSNLSISASQRGTC